MKRSTTIGVAILLVFLICGAVYAGMLIAKPAPALTEQTVVKAELPVGTWGLVLQTVDRQSNKLAAALPGDTAIKREAMDSIRLAVNTVRKTLTDQNAILKNNTK